MKKLPLPLLVATTITLTACCECEIPESRYSTNDSAIKSEHNDDHHGRHGHDHNKHKGQDANHNTHGMKALPAALSSGALMLADSPLTNSGWDYKQLSVGKGILNFFNGNNISSLNGNLAQHKFFASEDQDNFSQPDFDQAANEYMQTIGAVEFFNGSLPEAIASELHDMVGFNSGDYTNINPTNHTLRQYMTNTNGKQILYQVISDANHGEIGVFSIETAPSAMSVTATTPEPEPATKVNTEATNKTTAKVSELEVVEAVEENPAAKPNVQAQINLAPVVPLVEETVDDIENTSQDAKPAVVEEEKQESQAKPTETVSSENMQSQLGGDSGAITLNINFDTSKATIRNDNLYIIDELHKLLRQYPDLKFVIQGHTDDVGEADMNQRLSLARAKEVKAELEKKGIDSDRLKAEGYGESKPVVDNTSDENRARNRRVELVQF